MEIGREGAGYQAVAPGEWSIRDADARAYVREATRAVASLVRSTFGPYGMEKQLHTRTLQDEPETVQTADASEILDAIERGDGFSHPVAALFVDAVDSMQRGLGDGATTAVLLAAALVDRGLDLVEEGVHPSSVVVGYALAAGRAGQALDEMVREVDAGETERLRQVAATAMTGGLEDDARERAAALVVEAVQGLADAGEGWLDTDDVTVLAAPGEPGALVRGVVVRRWPGPLDESEAATEEFDWSLLDAREDAMVALLDREIDFERSATAFGGDGDPGVEVRSTERLKRYRAGRQARIDVTADRLADMGVDILVSQEAVGETVATAFEARDVAVVDEVKYPLSDVYRLARASGGEVVPHVDDLTPDHLGTVGRASERRVGDEKWTVFEGCSGAVFTLVVDPETETGRARRERIVEDALEVTSTAVLDRQLLPGAGAPALAVADDLRAFATTVGGREQLAVEAFGDALSDLVRALAENAGVDPLATLADLRSAHAAVDGPAALGLDPATGGPVDTWDAGVVEPRRIFSQAVETARATTEQLLTIDAVLFPGVDLEAFAPRSEHD